MRSPPSRIAGWLRRIRTPAVTALFLVAAVTALILFRPAPGDQPARAQDAGAKVAPVSVTPARTMTFVRGVAVSGNAQSVNYALVSARVPGTLDTVLVDEGDAVVAGVTDLFHTDSIKLTQALEVARQNLAVAESSARERAAYQIEVRAEYAQAKADAERFRRLRAKEAVTAHELEMRETAFTKWEASVAHAEASVTLAAAQKQSAASAVVMAEKDLSDSRVKAPINGRVSERMKEPGEMAAAGTPVLKIDDLTRIEISAFLPEEHYARVAPGTTRLRAKAGDTVLGEIPVSYKSPTIDPQLRTFEIKADLTDPPAGIVPGRIVHVTVILEQREGVGVPTNAVLERGGRSVVFGVDNDTARQQTVQTGLETDGWIEVLDEAIAADAPVVSLGQDFLDDGSKVRVIEEVR